MNEPEIYIMLQSSLVTDTPNNNTCSDLHNFALRGEIDNFLTNYV